MGYRISFECISHVGKIRKTNQDNFLCDMQYLPQNQPNMQAAVQGVCDTKKPTLFGVFDGMGGESHGEIASYIAACNAAGFRFSKPKNAVLELESLCRQMNMEICNYAERQTGFSMGTTAAMLLFDRKGISLCNIGDSKIFRFSDGHLNQISQDHLGIAAFGVKPPLTQNLGIPPSESAIEPYFAKGTYHKGDIYLLCSDGLTDMVSNERITDVLLTHPLPSAAQVLLETALAGGGKDNITILLCEIVK